MDEIKLSDDAIEQIKDFVHDDLTEEQNSLIDKLILNEKLKERYKKYDLCYKCSQINTGRNYYRSSIWEDGWIFFNDNGQLGRDNNTKVALKFLHNSQDITADFLKEIESNILACDPSSGLVVRCFGIAKDPKTNNFMMVMKLKECSLRQHLDINFDSLSWHDKLILLYCVSYGLDDIHNSGLIHHDFHCGNLLSNFGIAYITDLGLCQLANVKSSQNDKEKIYGVLPYVAPEVLRGKEYTQESDIYGFGIIAYEICTGLPPYHDIPHDEFLAMKICNGLRPKSNYKIPQLIFDIINQCWDADPSKRPKAVELHKLYDDLRYNCVQSPLSCTGTLSYTTHPQAIYTSRLLDFKNLPEPKNADNNVDLIKKEYSELFLPNLTLILKMKVIKSDYLNDII
ncbi:kinase-like domain-containing protein [Rhizophagus clarus]|uniref:Kinase-like domain-containing protein n=1 Tax=Rhizophagus clarus TaxID=94130 RepID=A0A8H3MB31_9GLOM|nr:kinase-like domain-containing protein [Rhizophagus clarus]